MDKRLLCHSLFASVDVGCLSSNPPISQYAILISYLLHHFFSFEYPSPARYRPY